MLNANLWRGYWSEEQVRRLECPFSLLFGHNSLGASYALLLLRRGWACPARRPRLENSSRLLQKNKKGGHTGHPISNREETFGRLGATFSLQQASQPLVERASAPAAPVCATRRTCLP